MLTNLFYNKLASASAPQLWCEIDSIHLSICSNLHKLLGLSEGKVEILCPATFDITKFINKTKVTANHSYLSLAQ